MSSRPTKRLSQLLADATGRFVGHGGVVGVALGGDNDLTVLPADHDPDQERALLSWAKRHAVSLGFIVTGRFVS